MPMVPGLTANMPSRISEDNPGLLSRDNEEVYLWENFLDHSDMILPTMSAADMLSPFDHFSDDMTDFSSYLMMDKNKRECLLGKTEEDCLRECGQECDPFIDQYVVRHWGPTSNLAIPHHYSAEELMMVNPQSVLPLQHQYSPYNDHCYHQTIIGYPDSEIKPVSSYESESPSDESADEIVDVETVQEKVEPAPPKVLKKRGRKPGQKLKFSRSKAVTFNRTPASKRSPVIQQGRVTKRQKRGKSSYEPSSASSSDAEGSGRRSNHNDMERQRRDVQKKQLQTLRVAVPSIRNNPKAPKVMILNEATKYCTQLNMQEKQYLKMLKTQSDKNNELKARLARLQKIVKLQ